MNISTIVLSIMLGIVLILTISILCLEYISSRKQNTVLFVALSVIIFLQGLYLFVK